MVYENFPLPVWVTDSKFKVFMANKAARDFALDPFSGLDTKDVDSLKALKHNEKLSLKWNSESGALWLNWQSWIEEEKIYFTSDDITSYKKEETYFQQILNAIPDMILVKEKESRIRWANRAFQDYYGMTNEELSQIIDAPFQLPELTQQYVKEDAWVWNNKKKMFIDCETVLRFDGVPRQFQTIKAPILNEAGETQFSVGVSRDITEKLEYEHKSFAAAKMASLGEMAGGIAHEINNPISIIIGKAAQIKRLHQDEKLLTGIDIIERNALRVAKIVEGLRNFCQEGDKQKIGNFDIQTVLDETLTYCHDRLSREKIKLEVYTSEKDIFVGKKVQISQIILNLLNNAIDSVHGQPNAWIKITSSLKNNQLELRISDSGKGVAKDIEEKFMQPFFTTKEIGKGTGLGLSISFSLAKQNNGSLLLDRNVSASCFLLSLPALGN